MIFSALDKIKRNAIFNAVGMMGLGVLVLVFPAQYGPTLLLGLGFIVAVIAIVLMLNFLTSNKSLMEFVKFVGAIALLVAAICILIYRENTLLALAVSFGVLIILDGLRTMIHSLTFARRAHRRAWWVLSILSLLLVGIGIMLIANPWTSTQDTLLKAIGLALLFASLVSVFRLIWTWPIVDDKKYQEENENA